MRVGKSGMPTATAHSPLELAGNASMAAELLPDEYVDRVMG